MRLCTILVRGVFVGLLAGAAAGGVIGSCLFPVVGTIFGGAVGGFAGAPAGLVAATVVWVVLFAGRPVGLVPTRRSVAFVAAMACGIEGAITAVALTGRAIPSVLAGLACFGIGFGLGPLALPSSARPVLTRAHRRDDERQARRARRRTLTMQEWVLRGVITGSIVGCGVGLIVGIAVYPPTAPFAAVEIGFPAGTVGAAAGVLACLLSEQRRRWRASTIARPEIRG